MYKRIISLLVLCTMTIGLLGGCANTQEPISPTLPALQSSSLATERNDEDVVLAADGYDVLGGFWVVGGFYYEQNNKRYLIDVSDDDTLEKIYLSEYLTFDEDGTFLYAGTLNNRRGKYIRKDHRKFILKTDEVFTYTFTGDVFVETVVEDAQKTSYIISLLDENTLLWNIFDPNTGTAKIDSSPLVYERECAESDYIKKNKTTLKNSSKNQDQEADAITTGMRKALQSAKQYLSIMSFSYTGLIEQLEYEGYSTKEATYAADNCGADWFEQAVRSARSYLDIMSFSRSGLIDQLEYEGYTHEQAVYGVDKVY